MTQVTTDTLLLAGSLDVHSGSVVIELGCGSGGAIFFSSTLNPGCIWIGIDLQIELLQMMLKSNELLKSTIDISGVCCNVESVSSCFPGEIADAVIANPPFGLNRSTRNSPDRMRDISRSGSDLLLYHFLRASSHLLVPGGLFIMINRPALLPKMILGYQSAGITPDMLQPIGLQGKPATHIILHGRKGSSSGMRILPQVESEELLQEINDISN